MLQLMLMMLACLAGWEKRGAADAHDARRAWLTGEGVLRLMLMMLACPAG